jgi:hypothetical protein
MFLSTNRQLPHMRCFQRKYTTFQAELQRSKGFVKQASSFTLKVVFNALFGRELCLGAVAVVGHSLAEYSSGLVVVIDTPCLSADSNNQGFIGMLAAVKRRHTSIDSGWGA